MVEAMESIKTAAIHADARAELANLLEKAAEELAVGAIFPVSMAIFINSFLYVYQRVDVIDVPNSHWLVDENRGGWRLTPK